MTDYSVLLRGIKTQSNLTKYKAVQDISQLELAQAKKKYWEEFSLNSYDKLNQVRDRNLYRFLSNSMKTAISTLTRFEMEIFEREFVWYIEDSQWYEDFCSKSTYYKRRNSLVDKFLNIYLD
ncbi:hypothetical protein MCAL160_0069 [Mycoplasmopsis californica HAZ160_1]|uniref:Uncharacterized protein n=2 Tax=Mycoplasmopsis californica TaxID=2113 RepID=A0A059XSD5_9BACT|nr:hypothetical protein [Mycoplasmopsis californica]AIA29718.1 hypothetical protein MCFN_03015 [Mycoplasmopsis californica]BAP00813.1 hypothetical protein MCAL160_0069 [Mycoplasmopsis californica HAZ160_1]BBG40668.1 hypothetical protein MCAL106_0069 [Mycoplasmopsis californica]BBG41263.1 hypothetical protein MCAL106E_0069 [Mycoplasmopsis californica]BBG41856.1 hypothetical protein MCAL106L_0069 [Mycoplasmopsis californica]